MKVVTIQFSPLSAVLAATWSPGATCLRRWWLRGVSRQSQALPFAAPPGYAPLPRVVARARRAILRLRRLVLRLRVLHLPQVWRVHPAACVVCVRLRVDVRVGHAVRSRAAHVRPLHLQRRVNSVRGEEREPRPRTPAGGPRS